MRDKMMKLFRIHLNRTKKMEDREVLAFLIAALNPLEVQTIDPDRRPEFYSKLITPSYTYLMLESDYERAKQEAIAKQKEKENETH